MKVVLFAGGLGTRMREETEYRPKPMVLVGGRPILWHIMKTYAHYGHTEFVVLTGYKAEYIREYFYNYGPLNLDFTITLGDRQGVEFHGSHDEFDWRVTVLYTGETTNTGGRLLQARKYLGEEDFLCTYGDGVADINIDSLLKAHKKGGRPATVSVASPPSRFGILDFGTHGEVEGFREKPLVDDWVNIGYFVFGPSIFDVLQEDSVLESEPLQTLARQSQLNAYRHEGFWQPMDTVREMALLEGLWQSGSAPWKRW
jgi:glucose-1-phosphate cytidylyltransferase